MASRTILQIQVTNKWNKDRRRGIDEVEEPVAVPSKHCDIMEEMASNSG